MSSFHINAAKNQGRPCRAEGCNLGRDSISPYCRRHKKSAERFGHPHGFTLSPKRDYAIERELVIKFLKKHAEHRGVKKALAWLQDWLDRPVQGRPIPCGKEIARLAEHGVTAHAILVEAAALFLLSRWNPRRLPDDDRLTWAIGLRVLSLAPRAKRNGYLNGKPRQFYVDIRKTERRAVGSRIRNTLVYLLLNIALGIEAEESARREQVAAFHAPFPTNNSEQ